MDRRSDSLICPDCHHEHDPQFRFCTQCGAKLPTPSTSVDSSAAKPSGRARGVEPKPDELFQEPVYDGGGGARIPDTDPGEPPLPVYASSDDDDEKKKPLEEKDKIPAQPGCCAVGFFVPLAIAVPPIGLITSLVWFFMPAYRKAALSTFLASIIGLGLWGWIWWIDNRAHMYDAPATVLEQYMEAQDWALSENGHYYSMMDLQINGFLPSDFPPELSLEFTIEEHVLGPTGYLVEIRPGTEEFTLYRMESLWMDHTGDIRIGSMDGPRYSR